MRFWGGASLQSDKSDRLSTAFGQGQPGDKFPLFSFFSSCDQEIKPKLSEFTSLGLPAPTIK